MKKPFKPVDLVVITAHQSENGTAVTFAPRFNSASTFTLAAVSGTITWTGNPLFLAALATP